MKGVRGMAKQYRSCVLIEMMAYINTESDNNQQAITSSEQIGEDLACHLQHELSLSMLPYKPKDVEITSYSARTMNVVEAGGEDT